MRQTTSTTGSEDVEASVLRRVAALRDAWLRAWPEASADPLRRDAMIDLHVSIHAAEQLMGGWSAPPPTSVGDVDLVAQVVHASWPGTDADGVAAALPTTGRPVARVERSGPGWLLSGSAGEVVGPAAPSGLLVLAIDEGDNEMAALVDGGRPGVRVGPSGAWFDAVPVTDDRLVHVPDVRATLTDALTVVRLAATIGRGDDLLARAALRAAAAAIGSTSIVRRQHDVSAAAVLALRGVDDEVAAWHRQRLAPLI